MDTRTFDKAKLVSRHVTEGPARAPHRSYYYAMGLTDEEIHRPFVGARMVPIRSSVRSRALSSTTFRLVS